MNQKLIVLLPPSEGKQPDGVKKATSDVFARSLGTEREMVKRALREALATESRAKLEKLLKVKGPLLDRALSATELYVANKAPVLKAFERYSGVVWTHLEPATLTKTQRDRILIPSGVYGVTTANDDIADYRLKMDVRLGDVGLVSTFWRSSVSQVIAKATKGTTLVNLLPKEHEQAIDFDLLRETTDVRSIQFLTATGNGVAGHDAKAVKGVVARLLITSGWDALRGFEWQGWKSVGTGSELQVRAPKKKLS